MERVKIVYQRVSNTKIIEIDFPTFLNFVSKVARKQSASKSIYVWGIIFPQNTSIFIPYQ